MASNQTNTDDSKEQEETEHKEPFQTVGHKVRQLTLEEQQRLYNDTRIVSEFKQNKLEAEAKKNWDLFYKRNTTKFFKDRHWTTREFHELCGHKVKVLIKRVVIETTGVCANNVARGVMTLCCDVTLCYVTLRHDVMSFAIHMFIGFFFQNALVDHIGLCRHQ